MRRFVLPVLSLLAACGAPALDGEGIVYDPCGTVVLAPQPDTSAAERASMQQAIALWRDVGLTTLTLDESANAARVPVRFAVGPSAFHGVYEPSLGLVTVNRVLADRERDVTVAHEVGHALGLPHVDPAERVSLMNPGNLTVVPTADDAAALDALWGCAALSP